MTYILTFIAGAIFSLVVAYAVMVFIIIRAEGSPDWDTMKLKTKKKKK